MSNKYPGGFISLGGPIPSYSVTFDGTGDYLNPGSQSAFAFGTGDFTVEGWIFATAASDSPIYEGRSSGSATDGFTLTAYSSSVIRIFSGSALISSSGTTYLNTWTHVAVVKVSGTTTLYVNGISVGTTASLGNITSTSAVVGGGRYGGGATIDYSFTGNISNFRIVKGTAVYTSNFVPPKGPATNISGTSLLTCQSPTIVDNSSNAFAITVSGNCAVSTNQPNFQAYNPNLLDPALGAATPGVWTLSQALAAEVTRSWPMYDPYYKNVVLNLHGNSGVGGSFASDASTNNFYVTVNGEARSSTLTPFSTSLNFPNGSGYFDGTGDYLTSTVTAIGSSGDITVEGWVYPTASGVRRTVLFIGSTGTYDLNLFTEITAANVLRFLIRNDATTDILDISSTATVSANTWSHVAFVLSGTSATIYLNGTSVATGTLSGSRTGTFTTGSVGALLSGGATHYFNGYLSNLRYVKGTAVYTSAFTPSTTPLGATSGGQNPPTGTQTSLLTLQTPNPANNNGFVDSSSNNFTITRNGNTTQGSFSPYGPSWSNYFNGSSDYLSLANSTALTMGTGDFTVEAWVYLPSVSVYSGIVSLGRYLYNGGIFRVTDSAKLQWYFNDATLLITSTNSVLANTWTHVAAVRSGGTTKLYINGVNSGSSADASNYNSTYATLIGADYQVSPANLLAGYVSNVRVVKGTAVYTGNFTPSTTPLTAISGTSLLTCQSNRFIDNSASPATITANGSPSVQRFQPFLFNTSYTPSTTGGSGYFDGTGDYLTAPYSASLEMGSSDFTIDFWIYPTSSAAIQVPVSQWETSGNKRSYNISIGTTGVLTLTTSSTGSGTGNTNAATAAGAIIFNTWNHVRISKSGTSAYVGANGVITTGSAVSTLYVTGTNVTMIGGYIPSAPALLVTGYICDVRIIKGTALDTGSTYTVPTAPLTAITNTSLLTSMTNGGIYDNAMMNDLETVGNAQISTSVKKYGTGSMYFDGSSYLKASPYRATGVSGSFDPIWDFGTGDFTVEAWIYYSTTTRNGSIVSNGGYGFGTADSSGWSLQVYSSGASLGFNTASTQNNFISANSGLVNSTLPNGQWNHIAVTRSGTNLRCFVNGVQVGSTITNSVNCDGGSTYVPKIAADQNGQSSYMLTGYIDDLRITKGVARYVANFTPPTSQLQDQ